jgi:hypothetical protein
MDDQIKDDVHCARIEEITHLRKWAYVKTDLK